MWRLNGRGCGGTNYRMFNRPLDCLSNPSAEARPVFALRPHALAAFLDRSPGGPFLRASGFAAAEAEVQLLPGPDGLAGAVIGLGDSRSPLVFGALATSLPAGDWVVQPGDHDPQDAVLGFCLGAYRFEALRKPAQPGPLLLAPPGPALSAAHATWLVRDLINTPADRLGPTELAQAVVDVGETFGATSWRVTGAELARCYPAIAIVGAGSVRPPVVVTLRWQGSQAGLDAPLLSLCGKGVCFDTGGYDIKPSAGMLRMKKDMGGAAILLGLARMVMAADLPIRLCLRVGCVENSISGGAMRPSDVIATRHGLSVEVGNTDAEGRLVLCDMLSEACAENPALLVDAATLTGAARVALGPDVVALFCNDDALATQLQEAGRAVHDPVWRLPLWSGYDPWLASKVADISSTSSRPMAGAVTAALFLQKFVRPGVSWAHLDTYAWNDNGRPGRPEGGEAQAMRALFTHVQTSLLKSKIKSM